MLDKQIELSEKLLAITRAEKQALISMDIDSLFSLARSKNKSLDLIAEGDTEIRQKIAKITAGDESKRNNSLKLFDLVPFLGTEESAPIRDKRNRLVELREKIITDNMVNKQFSNSVLGYLEDAVSLILNGIQENTIYNRQKRGMAEISRPALLSKEI